MEIKKVIKKPGTAKPTEKKKKTITIAKDPTKKPILKIEAKKTNKPKTNKPVEIVKKQKIKKKKTGRIFNTILSIIMFFGIGVMLVVMVFCGYIALSAPAFNTDLLYSTEASIFYDRNGNEFARVGAEQRELVYYDDLPQVLVDAIVATEDSRYFQHNGFDVVRFMKASLQQLAGRSDAGGASTLTMQVVKNTFTSTNAVGIEGIIRKFTDIYMSIFLVEKNYTKEEIIEFYVNDPYLGNYSYGVEQACKNYFGKSVKDLTLTEAALIAGLFNAPGSYDPTIYPELATQRRNIVLNLMVRHGYITEEQAADAKAIKVESLLKDQQAAKLNKYQQFIDIVCREIAKKYKGTEYEGLDPYSTPMEIYTTMDPDLQQVMIDINETYDFKTYSYNKNKDVFQLGAAVTSVKDGSIVAVNGGRNQTKAKGWGRADQTKTQIGSTAKPIFAYGPYLEYNNGSTGTVFMDAAMTYSNGTPVKNSVSGDYVGPITMRRALVESRNTAAIQAFMQTDKSKISEYVHNLGIDYGDNLYESHAIGGGLALSPLDMAGAYGAFAREGYYIEPYSYTKLVLRESDEILEEFKYTKVKAMSEETAYMITDMLIDTAQASFNYSYYSGVKGTDIALKTGTSTWDWNQLKAHGISDYYASRSSADNWRVLYSPDYVISLWYGVDNLGKDSYTLAVNATNETARLTKIMAEKILKRNSRFSKPSGVISATYEFETLPAELPSDYTPSGKIKKELFKKGTEPSEESKRYSQLDNPRNGSVEVYNNQIVLNWDSISTPKAIDNNYLTEYFNETFNSKIVSNLFLKNRKSYNKKNIGDIGYQVYLQTDTGLQDLGFTTNPYFSYQASTSGVYTFVIKSTYSIFKSNASTGITLTANIGNNPPGTPEDNPEIETPNTPEDPELPNVPMISNKDKEDLLT